MQEMCSFVFGARGVNPLAGNTNPVGWDMIHVACGGGNLLLSRSVNLVA